MKYFLIFILFGVCTLVIQSIDIFLDQKQEWYVNHDMNYEIYFPPLFIDRDFWSESNSNSSGPFFGSKINTIIDSPFLFREASVKIHHITSPCSPEETGLIYESGDTFRSLTTPLPSAGGDLTGWGRISEETAYFMAPNTICKVPNNPAAIKGSCGSGSRCDPPWFTEPGDEILEKLKDCVPEPPCITTQAAYGFCSQNGDKTVVICLSQMQNDPKMAEEIFSTFRWLEE